MSYKKNLPTKVKLIEAWNVIDNILFGNNKPNEYLDENTLKQYYENKCSLLLNLYEFYQNINYDPNLQYNNEKEVIKEAVNIAKQSSIYAKKYFEENVKEEDIKEKVNSINENSDKDIETRIKYNIKKEVALDKYLVVDPVNDKNSCSVCLEQYNTKLIIDSHKKLRDNLINTITNVQKQ